MCVRLCLYDGGLDGAPRPSGGEQGEMLQSVGSQARKCVVARDKSGVEVLIFGKVGLLAVGSCVTARAGSCGEMAGHRASWGLAV